MSNSFDWLSSLRLDSNYQSELMLKETLLFGVPLYKLFTKNSLILSNDSAVIREVQVKEVNGVLNRAFVNTDFPFKFQLNLENLPSYQYLTGLIVPYDEYVDLSKIQVIELVGSPDQIRIDVNLKDRTSNALYVLTKDFWKFLFGLKMI